MKLQNHAYVRDPFKVKESPVDFNVRENEEFIAIVTDSTLQTNSKKLIVI